ncbi:MAG: hypothetical protein WC553_01985 [Patescibacteria group bacterium]|jgi:hypothetical protein
MSTGMNASEPVTEIFGKTNIGGYAICPAANLEDGRHFEKLAIPECELERLADRLHLTSQELQELLTTKAGELTLKQLVAVLHFIRTLWSSDDGKVVNFELSVGPIDPEFLGNYDPPQ